MPLATSTLPRRPPGNLYAVARAGLLTVAAAIGAVAVIVFGVALVLGLRPLAVTSQAMEPGIPVGCVMVSREVPATQVQVGGIVTLQRLRGGGPVTSRVVGATSLGNGAVKFVLRGDADGRDDPEPYVASTVGAYVMQVPWAGHLGMLFDGRLGSLAGGTVALMLVIVLVVDPQRKKAPRRLSGEPSD